MKWMFDCDDTLYDLQAPFNETMAEFFPNLDADLDELYKEFRKIGDDVFEIQEAGIISMDASVIYRVVMLCKNKNLDWDIDMAKRFVRTYRDHQYHISLSPIFKEFLEEYGKDVVVLSNGQDEHQRRKFKSLQFDKYIPEHHLFTSGQIGVAKPNKEAFLKVLDILGEKPEDWTYVGDHYENDMLGASSAGMHTLQINRHHHQEGPAAEKVVYSEEECLAFIRNKE